jgi:hypothetical protein
MDSLLRFERISSENCGRLNTLRFECITVFRDLIIELRGLLPTEAFTTGQFPVRIFSSETPAKGSPADSISKLWDQCSECIEIHRDGTLSLTFEFCGTKFTIYSQPGPDHHNVTFSCANDGDELQICATFPDRAIRVERICDHEGGLIRVSEEQRYRHDLMQNPFEDRSYLHPLINAMAEGAAEYWKEFTVIP